ncbi:MAG: radical SAM protein [Candidatus Aenigmatarchaeota archaeon]
MKIEEVQCKSTLSNTKLYGLDYSVNPYTGCGHSCAYCYAVYMKKFTDHEEDWGSFVDVKVNAPEVLRKEVKKKDSGSVLLSSVTDAYQPLEERYGITRELLEILQENGFSVSILTKSDLVLRDLDVLKKFDHGRLSVGFTVNFTEEEDRKIWEPEASSIEERIEGLKKLHEEGIPTYVHVGPWLEGITDLEKILEKVEDYIYEFQVENLNKKRGEIVMKVIRENYPGLAEKYEHIMEDLSGHNKRLKEEAKTLRRKSSVPVKVYVD